MATLTTDTAVERLYRARSTPELVVVPSLRFLCLDGHGDPNTSPAYADAVQALYAVSYAAKFAVRKAGGTDFRVSPLEGFWSAEDMGTFVTGEKGAWDWTMVIRQPDSVTEALVARLVEEVAEKKALPAVRDLRLETITEGTAAQVLHVGPYAAEGPTIQRLHDFIHEQGFVFPGDVERHHEIYLGDPRRAAPEKLRTIIRQAYRRP
jgi:hypothetical protein